MKRFSSTFLRCEVLQLTGCGLLARQTVREQRSMSKEATPLPIENHSVGAISKARILHCYRNGIAVIQAGESCNYQYHGGRAVAA